MRETELIRHIRTLARTGAMPRQLVKGIGDDCAVVRPSPGKDLVFTTDFVLEDRHFERHTHSAAVVGHKALARSLSDLAAMGAEPLFFLVALAIPSDLAGRWTTSFYEGLLALAAKFNIALAGGDLARFDNILVDIMCCGQVPKGKALLRSGAKPGDAIYVTGELGASAHGLATHRGAPWRRHLRPEPRIPAGLVLRRLGATACIDLSDGLSLDLARLCLESKTGAELTGTLPVARQASREEALHGGEDYELLFTVPGKKKVPKIVAGTSVTRIGTMTKARPGRIQFEGRALPSGGFDHFS